jgi:hypothetical protein
MTAAFTNRKHDDEVSDHAWRMERQGQRLLEYRPVSAGIRDVPEVTHNLIWERPEYLRQAPMTDDIRPGLPLGEPVPPRGSGWMWCRIGRYRTVPNRRVHRGATQAGPVRCAIAEAKRAAPTRAGPYGNVAFAPAASPRQIASTAMLTAA